MVTTYVEEERVVTGGAVPRALAGSSESAVSWAAIFAGALAAAVLSLLLFMLGIGLGLSSVSVWSGRGADGETLGWGAVAWLAFTQLASAGVGGYIAGRLRTKWQGVHTDEVYFRDTAHGFLSWALATMLMVAIAGSMAGAAISGTAKAAGAVVSGAAQVVGGAASGATGVIGGAASAALTGAAGVTAGKANEPGSDLNYWINSLLRQGGPTEQQKQDMKDGAQNVAQKARSAADDASEMSSVFMHSLQAGSLSNDDRQYLGRLVAQRTDMSQEESEKKVQATYDQVKQQIDKAKQAAQDAEAKAKQTAEQARKATAYSLMWMFVVLLIGAFVGSLSATFGGRQRDA
ncbi:MAG: hypothetical protein LBE58_17260 [Comamonas sp.]|jgi:hypothetical protein|nr:hypothetical protein [Comamonas sp.]